MGWRHQMPKWYAMLWVLFGVFVLPIIIEFVITGEVERSEYSGDLGIAFYVLVVLGIIIFGAKKLKKFKKRKSDQSKEKREG